MGWMADECSCGCDRLLDVNPPLCSCREASFGYQIGSLEHECLLPSALASTYPSDALLAPSLVPSLVSPSPTWQATPLNQHARESLWSTWSQTPPTTRHCSSLQQ